MVVCLPFFYDRVHNALLFVFMMLATAINDECLETLAILKWYFCSSGIDNIKMKITVNIKIEIYL